MSKASLYYTLKNVNGNHDIKQIKNGIDKLTGIISVSINTVNNIISVDYDDTGCSFDEITRKLESFGYEILDVKLEIHTM